MQVFFFPHQVGEGLIDWEDCAKMSALRDKVMGSWPKDDAGWPLHMDADMEAQYLADLPADERHCMLGLGGSQKAEVAWLDKNGIPYQRLDVEHFSDLRTNSNYTEQHGLVRSETDEAFGENRIPAEKAAAKLTSAHQPTESSVESEILDPTGPQVNPPPKGLAATNFSSAFDFTQTSRRQVQVHGGNDLRHNHSRRVMNRHGSNGNDQGGGAGSDQSEPGSKQKHREHREQQLLHEKTRSQKRVVRKMKKQQHHKNQQQHPQHDQQQTENPIFNQDEILVISPNDGHVEQTHIHTHNHTKREVVV
jgi:hypothetical protein